MNMGEGTGDSREAETLGHYVDSKVPLEGGVFCNKMTHAGHKRRSPRAYRVDRESPKDSPLLLAVTYVSPETHRPLKRNRGDFKGSLSVKLHREDSVIVPPNAARERN
jgi:hypothetical protein